MKPELPHRSTFPWLAWGMTAVVIACVAVHGLNLLTIDYVTLGLIALAALCWLAPSIRELEVTGVGKLRMRSLVARVEQVETETIALRTKSQQDNLRIEIAVAANKALLAVGDLESRAFRLAHSHETVRRTALEAILRAPLLADRIRMAAGDDQGMDLCADVFAFVDTAKRSLRSVLGTTLITPKTEMLELVQELEQSISEQLNTIEGLTQAAESVRRSLGAAIRELGA